MDIWDIAVYLFWSLLAIGISVLVFIIWALAYVSKDDEEMERMMLEGIT